MRLDLRRVWLARAAALDTLVEAGEIEAEEAIRTLVDAFWRIIWEEGECQSSSPACTVRTPAP